MLRIHFTADDLGRVTLVPAPNHVCETALAAVIATHEARPPHGLERWRSRVLGGITPVMRPLLDLVGPCGFPDFIEPPADLEPRAQLASVRATPARLLRSEVESWTARSGRPGASPFLRRLARGEEGARDDLVRALEAFGALALRDLPDRWGDGFAFEHAGRTERLAEEGVIALLSDLHPSASWSRGVLTIGAAAPRHTAEIHLGGRGLVVGATRFAAWPTFSDMAGRPPAVFLPRTTRSFEGSTARALVDLLGRRRALVVAALRAPRTTTGVAAAVGCSLSSASEHLAVLRAAGIVVSSRDGRAVRHGLTELGRGLLARAVAEEAPITESPTPRRVS